MPPGTRLKLDPRDEGTHAPEAAGHYNESMYFNAFDSARGIGLWVRLGIRPNEGHAEMSCCVHLPGGRVGFMFARPKIEHNREMAAAGMRFEVIEPFRRQRVSYAGELLVMDEPMAMADPSSAFKCFPRRPAIIELDFEGVSPMHGGEIVHRDGSPWALDPEQAVYRGHTEQNMAVEGHVSIDGQRFDLRGGTGYRDKSRGPRHWHSFSWYKWLPVTFSRDVGAQYMPRGLQAWVKTAAGEYQITCRVLTTVPLRHKLKTGSDSGRTARITESMTEYRCGDLFVLGMTEYCDVMTDGVPLSVSEERALA